MLPEETGRTRGKQRRGPPKPASVADLASQVAAGLRPLKPRAETRQNLLERADRALFWAKAGGGDQWKISEC